MSIILGLLKERGALVREPELGCLSTATKRYSTGPEAVYACGRLGMGFQPYASHARSAMDGRPVVDRHGYAIIFDGRLDNYEELAGILGVEASIASDSQIVLEAFRIRSSIRIARGSGSIPFSSSAIAGLTRCR